MNKAEAEAFRGVLMKGERILWSGRPTQGLALDKRDAVLALFSLACVGLVLFVGYRVASSGGVPLLPLLWLVPFLAFGLYLAAGRFLHDAYVRQRLHYAVTDRRILILRTGRNPTALRLDQPLQARLEQRGDGRGTITFGEAASAPKLAAIHDAPAVLALIQQEQRRAQAA